MKSTGHALQFLAHVPNVVGLVSSGGTCDGWLEGCWGRCSGTTNDGDGLHDGLQMTLEGWISQMDADGDG